MTAKRIIMEMATKITVSPLCERLSVVYTFSLEMFFFTVL